MQRYKIRQLVLHIECGSIQDEIADILIYLCAIANRFDIDMEEG